jgi:hypothetical protein
MKPTHAFIAAATTGILAGLAGCSRDTPTGSASTAASAMPMTAGSTPGTAKHGCKGQNSCKGQGGCGTDKHACKGQNDCKGQGGCKTA